MALDENTKKELEKVMGPIVKSALSVAAVAAASAIVSKLLVTNVKRSGLTGDTELKPTEDEVAISKVESSASGVEGAIAKDEVTGLDGDISAAKTEGKALTGEATAMEGGATAARTKAGAVDIETKGVKMT